MTPRRKTLLRTAHAALDAHPDLADLVLLAAEYRKRGTAARVGSPADAFAVLGPLVADPGHERLAALALSHRRQVVEAAVLSEGSAAYTIVDLAAVIRWALTRPSPVTAVVVAHNHPSGDPEPSLDDAAVTTRLAEACAAVGLRLTDHLVVAGDRFVSLAERGLIDLARPRPAVATETGGRGCPRAWRKGNRSKRPRGCLR